MGVFICWSGDRSHAIADALQTLLSQTLPLNESSIFLSKEIDKGVEWFQAVRTGLDSSRAGIVVLTHENIHSPWMHFEAGALVSSLPADSTVEANAAGAAAAVVGSVVDLHPTTTAPSSLALPSAVLAPVAPGRKTIFPLLHGVNAGELTGPLAAYQSTSTTREDMGRLVCGLRRILGIPAETKAGESVIPTAHWDSFETTLKNATAPLAKVIPDFETLFARKAFEEAFQQCTSQDWLARYEAARTTRQRLQEQVQLVEAACPEHEQGLFKMLLTDLDVYAMAIKALLIPPMTFDLGSDGELEMDGGIRTCCENQRLAIKSVSMRLVHPLDIPLTTAAIRFMGAATHEERRAIVHRVEGRIRWHREVAYEAALTKGRPEAERVALTELMKETTHAADRKPDPPSLSKPEPILQCDCPDRLMNFRNSSWDLDRIFYYRLVYYFETSAFRWSKSAGLHAHASSEDRPATIAPPMEHDLFCAARDVEMECERYRARTKGGSLMPLTYALDALQGLHPRKYPTERVTTAVDSAIQVIEKELGNVLESDEGVTIKELLQKLEVNVAKTVT